jgi:hypothetical protein
LLLDDHGEKILTDPALRSVGIAVFSHGYFSQR